MTHDTGFARHLRRVGTLMIALVVALGLLTPQAVGATDPTARVTGTFTDTIGSARVTTAYCSLPQNLAVEATENTATLRFGTCRAERTMLLIRRDLSPAPFGDGQVLEDSATTAHALTVRNLWPDTGYSYRLVSSENGGRELDAGTFRTRPARLTAVRVYPGATDVRIEFDTNVAVNSTVTMQGLDFPKITIPITNVSQAWLHRTGLKPCHQYTFTITNGDTLAHSGTFITDDPVTHCQVLRPV